MKVLTIIPLTFSLIAYVIGIASPLRQNALNWLGTRSEVVPVSQHTLRYLYTYAHLLDIAYCIDEFRRIDPPFECGLNCQSLFPHVRLVYQWYFDDSVCGYIASTNRSLINDTEKTSGLKPKEELTVIISLRGSRSVRDTMADINIDMIPYATPDNGIPICGARCRVHSGFYDYYKNTVEAIHPYVVSALQEAGQDAKLLIVGHSLGGAVGLFVALHYLALGFDNVKLVTMGQPLVGNEDFVDWADHIMGSDFSTNEPQNLRKWLRVVHRNDLVTTVPRGSFLGRYAQFNNQIYVNTSASNALPGAGQVVDCKLGSNERCIAGDLLHPRLASEYFISHNTYFRHLGLCGIHVDDARVLNDKK